MAGGGQFKNPYQQPGGAYGQAIGRNNIGGRQQMPTPRQIEPMGPGAGMAPMQGQMPQQVPQADPRMEYMKQLYSGQASAAARPGSGMASMLDAQINDRRRSSLQNPTYQPMPQQMPPGFERQFMPLTAQNPYSAMPQQMPQQTTNTRYLGELSTVPPEYRAQEEALRAYAAQRQQMPQGGVPLDMVYRGGPQMPQQQQQLPQTGGGMQQPPVMGLGGLGIAGLQRI
jgi:hypothetical protein